MNFLKKRLVCAACALALALSPAGCARRGAPGASAPLDAPPPETAPAQALASPAQAQYDFRVLPVTEEGVRTLYGWEGYEVREVLDYHGDFLVEYGYPGDGAFSLLGWVFGESGRRVQLTALTEFVSYRITGPGQVRYSVTGLDAGTPWMGLPESCEVRVLGDAYGRVSEQYAQTEEYAAPTWLDPARPLSMGFWDNGALSPGKRYHQLYDARIDADGLSFSFIPNGDSPEKYGSFFPACTTIPCFDTGFDPDTRVFTLRLYNTALESGALGAAALTGGEGNFQGALEAYGVTYPYSFPAGSLGRDGHFLTDAAVRADGEDAVVTFTLTGKAHRFTVESSNLGGDSIPCFRLVFREYDSDLDGWEAAE